MVIALKHVHKYFYFQHQRTLKEFFQAAVKKEKTLELVHAINNVNFAIDRGETVGIIGKNGAGKSTLLKLIAGVSKPTSGSVEIHGKLAPLIELGAGFHPELTGEENVYLNGIILGLTEKQVKERYNSIVEFAELKQFMDVPIKHYSSGMYIRLAFSIAVSTDPEILLVDEVLSVGDYEFQQKCQERMNEFRKNGTTIVLVSHDLPLISNFCDRTIVLEKGSVVFDGKSKEAVEKYHHT
jgi:ABC-2 type transport system ATP-binding protein